MIKRISIIFLLLIQLVLATNVQYDSFSITIRADETKTIEGHIIELKAIGNSGSVYVKVDGEGGLIENNVGDILIKRVLVGIISSTPHPETGGEATLSISIPKLDSCVSDIDCDDKDICNKDICSSESPRICIHLGSTCEFNGTCVPQGSIGGKRYCGLNIGWVAQKEKGGICSEDYECNSQNCINNACSGFLLGSNKNGLNIKNWTLIALAILIIIKLILIIISPKKFARLLGFLIFMLILIALLIYFFLK